MKDILDNCTDRTDVNLNTRNIFHYLYKVVEKWHYDYFNSSLAMHILGFVRN